MEGTEREETAKEIEVPRVPPQKKGERGGIRPVMVAIRDLRDGMREIEDRLDEIEHGSELAQTKTNAIMAGSLIECPECESFLKPTSFPKHWMKMHQPKQEIPEGRVTETPVKGKTIVIPEEEIEETPVIGEPLTWKSWETLLKETFPERPGEEIINALEKIATTMKEKSWIYRR